MAIKSYKSKRLSKRLSKSKSKSRSRLYKSKSRLSKNKRSLTKLHTKTIKKNKNHKKNHRGGFFGSSNCNIATVKERGFNLPSYGSGANQITGFSIPDTNAMIFNPNCASSPNQAMAP